MTAFCQPVAKLGADEAGPAGEEDLHDWECCLPAAAIVVPGGQ
jgi:hypothetical protein